MDNIEKALSISIVLMLIMLFSSFFYAFFNNMRLYFYLMKQKYNKWVTITTISGFGPGCSNPFRWFDYLFSDDDNDDAKILKYKNNVKIGLKYSLFVKVKLLPDSQPLSGLDV